MEELHKAIRDGDFERVQLLARSDFSVVDALNEKGKTAVSIAIENGHTEIAKWLLENGCLVSVTELKPKPAREDSEKQKETEEAKEVLQNVPSENCLSDAANAGETIPRPDFDTDAFFPPLLTAVHAGSIEMVKIVLESGRAHVEDSYKHFSPLMKACDEGYTDIATLLIKYGANVNGNHTPEYGDGDLDWIFKPLCSAVQKKHTDVVELLISHGANYLQVVPIEVYSFHVTAPSRMSQRPFGTLLELAVRLCQPVITSLLIDCYRGEITDQGRYYALLWSVKFQQTGMTELLLEKLYPASYNMETDEYGGKYRQVLRIAVRECPQSDETVPLALVERFGTKLFPQEEGFFIILHSAVLRSLPKLVIKLLEIAKDPSCSYDVSHYESWPDLCSAALYYGNKTILCALHENGFLDLSTQTDGENAFFEAIFSGRNGSSVYEVLSWLVDCGIDPSACDNNKMQPIHAAVTHRLTSAVDALCRLGVDANARMGTDDLPTPLHLQLNLRVLQLGCDLNLDLINVLVGHGADLAMENRKGYTPISILFWLLYANIQTQEAAQARDRANSVQGQRADQDERSEQNGGIVVDNPDVPHDPYRPVNSSTSVVSLQQIAVNVEGADRGATAAASAAADNEQRETDSNQNGQNAVHTQSSVSRGEGQMPFVQESVNSVSQHSEENATSHFPRSPGRQQSNENAAASGNVLPQNSQQNVLLRELRFTENVERQQVVAPTATVSLVSNAAAEAIVPTYLQPNSPWRTLIETLVAKFGVELFSMGAARLTGLQHWRKVYASLVHAGLDMGHLPSLQTMCWISVRKQLGGVRFCEKVNQLPLPEAMKMYLKTL